MFRTRSQSRLSHEQKIMQTQITSTDDLQSRVPGWIKHPAMTDTCSHPGSCITAFTAPAQTHTTCDAASHGQSVLEFCTGAGAVKSHGKPREYRGSGKNDHRSSCGSVGGGTDCCGNPAGPGVKYVLLPRDRESPPVP